MFLKKDTDADFDFEDKIYVNKGDMQGCIGIVKKFE